VDVFFVDPDERGDDRCTVLDQLVEEEEEEPYLEF